MMGETMIDSRKRALREASRVLRTDVSRFDWCGVLLAVAVIAGIVGWGCMIRWSLQGLAYLGR
jgi:hypothetical protein